MTSPTAKVFDNQSTSSAFAGLGTTAIIIVAVVALMYFGEMSFLTACFCTAALAIVFAIAGALFSFVLAPFLVAAIVALAAIGYVLFGIAVAVCNLFGLPFFKDKTA